MNFLLLISASALIAASPLASARPPAALLLGDTACPGSTTTASTAETQVISSTSPQADALAEARVAPEDGKPDAARVLRKTVLALRIRFLVSNWPVPAGADSTLLARTNAVLASGNPGTSSPTTGTSSPAADQIQLPTPNMRPLLQFVLGIGEQAPPTEHCLQAVYDALLIRFPGQLPAPPSPGAAALSSASTTGRSIAYYVLSPAGDALTSNTELTGSGVSFQQALVEGATAYLLDRARADLAQAGLEKLFEDLSTYKLESYLERTHHLVGLGEERDPRLYLRSLQAALAADFEGLPTVVATKLSEDSPAFELEPHHWRLAIQTLAVVSDVRRGTHPLQALSSFATRSQQDDDEGNDQLQDRLFELGVLAGALYSGSVETGGQTLSARTLLRSLDGRRLFASFLLAELEGTVEPVLDPSEVARVEARVVAMLQTLDDIVQELHTLREQFSQIRAANPEQAASVYADYLAVVTRAVRQVIMERSGDVSYDPSPVLQEVERLLAIREAAARGDYPEAVSLAMPYLTEVLPSDNPQALHLLVAVSSIAASPSSEEVYNTLALYSAPPRSYSKKRGREAHFRFSLNAYGGGTIGSEHTGDETVGHAGAYLPVGFELSRGFGWGSLGLFGSVLNFGTVADFQFSGSEESPAYASLAQLVSPGVYLTAGLTDDLPLTLGLGADYVPDLREAPLESAEENLGALRFSLFLGVDIPLYTW